MLAHELAHIKNHDMLLQTFTATLAGAIGNLAQFGLFFGGRDDEDSNPVAGIAMAILAPIAAMLIQFAISRQREFKANAVGAADHRAASLARERASQARGGCASHSDARGARGGAAGPSQPACSVSWRTDVAVLNTSAHGERVARLEALAA